MAIDVTNECWMDVVGYEGLYQVSTKGEIKSVARIAKYRRMDYRKVPEIVLKNTDRGNGYYCVTLSKNGCVTMKSVHKLVAEAFIPKPDGAQCINHKNGIKKDNTVGNLEWCTFSENNQHAYDTKLKKPTWKGKSSWEHPTSKPVNMLNHQGTFMKSFGSTREAGRYVNGNACHISQACMGARRSAFGYRWEYDAGVEFVEKRWWTE